MRTKVKIKKEPKSKFVIVRSYVYKNHTIFMYGGAHAEPPSLLPVGLRLAKAKPVYSRSEGPAVQTMRSKYLTTCVHVWKKAAASHRGAGSSSQQSTREGAGAPHNQK